MRAALQRLFRSGCAVPRHPARVSSQESPVGPGASRIVTRHVVWIGCAARARARGVPLSAPFLLRLLVGVVQRLLRHALHEVPRRVAVCGQEPRAHEGLLGAPPVPLPRAPRPSGDPRPEVLREALQERVVRRGRLGL
eukprot:CAMPEP_0183813678 /NCGR_PEP_ID=MMETSP0803_2-20130417/53547_1 /TAXON_ID=195967 /ORGANISM="Crustomastix stigmata, Strain CCMP3273" /LENGTH=137 /DNA_ID=CAMNT_0026058535 /DNA_START=1 /DNA_END=411 /DNA_ORIENTATION=+